MTLKDLIFAAGGGSGSGGGVNPTGAIEINENGEYDVTEFATAIVNVEFEGDLENGEVMKW